MIDALIIAGVVLLALLFVVRTRQVTAERAQREATLSEQRYRMLFDGHPEPMWVYDLDTLRFITVNQAALQAYGYTREQFLAMSIADIQVPSSSPEIDDGGKTGPRHSSTIRRHRKKDGAVLDTEVITHGLEWDDRRAGLVMARDITGRRQNEQLERDRRQVVEMVARNQPLEAVLIQLGNLVEHQTGEMRCAVVLPPNGRISSVKVSNLPMAVVDVLDEHVLEIMTGAARVVPASWQTVPVWDITRYGFWEKYKQIAALHGLRGCWAAPILAKTGARAGQALGAFVVFQREQRSFVPAELGLIEMATSLGSIAVEQHLLSTQLAHQAHHDTLTSLPNRLLFAQRLAEALRQAQARNGLFALLYVDLDRFKLVNDILGHKVGDALLKQVAERLAAHLRPSDTLARMGGDEFTLVLNDIEESARATTVAQSLVDTLSHPFDVFGHELFVTASIGVSIFPYDGRDTETLQRRADSAMYRAKNQGKNAYQCFSPEMETAPQRLELESQLRRALTSNELVLHYQPQYDTQTQQLVGFESLIRWQHPQLGMISPSEFIPIAEESGLIVPIGTWALEEVCRQNSRWQREGRPPVKVAVNISAVQFGRTDFLDVVSGALETFRLDPQYLEIELTESMVMRDVATSSRQMARLREIGVSIAIDDFGTGYSSLSYLQNLPVNTLKIDQSFVRQIAEGADTPPLIQAVVALGHGLGMKVTAEGVETVRQLSILQSVGCDKIQGYLMGRPSHARDIVWRSDPISVPTAAEGLLALEAQTSGKDSGLPSVSNGSPAAAALLKKLEAAASSTLT